MGIISEWLLLKSQIKLRLETEEDAILRMEFWMIQHQQMTNLS